MNKFSPHAGQVESDVAVVARFDYGALDPDVASHGARRGAGNSGSSRTSSRSRHLGAPCSGQKIDCLKGHSEWIRDEFGWSERLLSAMCPVVMDERQRAGGHCEDCRRTGVMLFADHVVERDGGRGVLRLLPRAQDDAGKRRPMGGLFIAY